MDVPSTITITAEINAVFTLDQIYFLKLPFLSANSLKNEWGTLYQTFAFSGTADCVIINSKAMSYYSPYALMLNIFLIDAFPIHFLN